MALTDEDLVRIVNEQDSPVQSAEMSQLIYRYTKVIRIKASRMKRFPTDTDDLMQEGFLGLLAAIRTYRPELGKFSAYAGVCIGNSMKNAAKSEKGLTPQEDYDFEQLSDEQTLTEDRVILKEHNSELFRKLKKTLSDKEFEVLRLYLSGFSYKEIAKRLSLTVKSVDNSLNRSRGKLKKLL